MKPQFRLIFLFLFFLFQSCQTDNSTSFSKKNKSEEFYLGGVHINEPDLQKWVNTVKDVGMNTVEVTAYAKQWFWNTADLEFDGIFDQVNEIKLAEEAGLNTVFISRVQLQHWFENQELSKYLRHLMPIARSRLY